MQNVRPSHPLHKLCLVAGWQAFFVLSFALQGVAQTTASPAYRRVDLGRGMWRVEPTASPAAKSDMRDATNAQVAGHMMAEARECAHAGQFDRARRLIQWASTLEVDWKVQPATPEVLLRELDVMESQWRADHPSPAALAAPPIAAAFEPGALEHNVLRLTKEDRPADSAEDFAGNTFTASAGEPGQPVVGGMPGGTSLAPRPLATDEGTELHVAPAESSGWGRKISRPMNSNLLTIPETRGFWRELAIIALCALVIVVMFAGLALRRLTVVHRDLIQAIESPRRAVAAAGSTPVPSAPLPAGLPGQLPPPGDLPWAEAKPATFVDQKQRAEAGRREQESELVRQLIATNVGIRKQVADKRATAA